MLKTGGERGREEEEKTSGEQNKSRRPPPNLCLSCAPVHSYAGSVFCSTSGLFLIPGEKRKKEEEGLEFT